MRPVVSHRHRQPDGAAAERRTVRATSRARRQAAGQAWFDAIQSFGLLVIIVTGSVVLGLATPVFFTAANLENVLYSATVIAVVAIGETFVILVAGIDLSVSAVLALSSVLSVGLVVNQGLPPAMGIVAALLAGAIIGVANGLACTKLRITALIVTLASLSIARGLAFIYSGGENIAPVPHFFVFAQNAKVLGFPVIILFTLLLALLAHLGLTRTRFGRSVYATGGNALAARLSGIRTDRVVLGCYAISGITAAIGGLMITARLEAGAATSGEGMELTVIAAVVIGGTSLFGGEGSIGGMLLGVLLLGLVQNAVDLLNVPPNYDSVVSGFVIAGAAALDVYRRYYVEASLRRRTGTGKQASPSASNSRALESSEQASVLPDSLHDQATGGMSK